MSSPQATAPSENWDDDFEYQQRKLSTHSGNEIDQVQPRISTASSGITDWDNDDGSRVRTPPKSSKVLEDKKNTYTTTSPTNLAEWAEPGPSTPTRSIAQPYLRLHTVQRSTENWDDDFEDSPRRPFPPPPQSTNATPSRRSRAGSHRTKLTLIQTHTPRVENWDDDFEADEPHSASKTSPGKRMRQSRHDSAYSSDSDTENRSRANQEDDFDDFGFVDKDEEDKTVTARSRRAAMPRLHTSAARGGSPPPVPALPLSFNIPSTNSFPQPQPFPRSPTSSVFSVPTSVGARPPSAYTVTSTTYLRPTVSRSSSGLGALPPSPPIHRERERRRLRKKSRPQTQGAIELHPIRLERERQSLDGIDLNRDTIFSTDQDIDMRPRTPPPGSSGADVPASPTANSSSRSGALLGRIGSVKKWGVRRKRGSTTPADVSGSIELHTFRHLEQENQSTPRPHSQTSMSSMPSSSESSHRSAERYIHRQNRRPNQSPPSLSNWFFRSSSNASSAISSPIGGRIGSASSSDLNLSVNDGIMDTPTRDSSRKAQQPETPSKLLKRKSLGFVQLRRGVGEPENGIEKGKRPMSMQPSPPTAGLPSGSHPPMPIMLREEEHILPPSDQTNDKEGSRGFIGGVRKISLVGRHKRTKSGVSLTHVAGSASNHPPSEQLKQSVPTQVEQVDEPPPQTPPTKQALLPPIELQPPSPPRNPRHAPIPISSSMPVFSLDSSPVVPQTSRSPTASTTKVNKSPGSPQSASLGRSTMGPILGSGSGNTKGSMSTASPMRRNSLGDLKIPERISQAQMGLRRDLGMVREFAASIEQLKELQTAYNDLVVDVQALLDKHAHSQILPPPRPPTQPQTQSRATSPSFFKPITRHRSNTNPSSTPPFANPIISPQLAYKQLASSFYTINSRYRFIWECAEVLIDVGSGGAPASSDAPDDMSIQTRSPEPMKLSSGRERAITLSGNESKPSTPVPGASPGARAISPPLASPTSLAWRASTGRHNLNNRQLFLLKEMLNNADSTSHLAEERNGRITIFEEVPFTQSLLNVNREWRWGDAMNSTVTLPSEESSGAGAGSSPKKRRSSRLGIGGLRDILRSLKRNQPDATPPIPPVPASTTSLSTENSSDQHRYPHARVPATHGRRRAKTSSGPEYVGLAASFEPPTSFASKPTPRRPSLASIFRLGHKNKHAFASPDLHSDGQLHPRSASSQSASGPESSSLGDEEDWDRIDSNSDLDLAAKVLGISGDGSSTVKGRSPYAENVPPSPAGHPIAAKRSVSGSQPLIWGEQPSRPTRLSNVEEHVGEQQQPRSASKSRRVKAEPSPSRPPSRSNRIPKNGSVRSMPPQPIIGQLSDVRLAMTPENIKPLLQNAKEVQARLRECIDEIKILLAAHQS